jgi:uncharacterized membrane protein (DUF2068 family)
MTSEGKTLQRRRSDVAIVAIGVFKLIKCVSLFAFGAALIHWRNADLGAVASHWVSKLWLSRPYFDELIARLSFMSQKTVDHFMIGSFVYSVLLAVEGIGLCLRKRWAEYLTVGITASLLPFEFYELSRRMTKTGVAITVVNIAIVVYLVVRLVRERRH